MTFQAPKGVSEYVPPRSALLEEAREAFAGSARRACYGYLETALRRSGIRADMAFGGRGLKGGMRAADRSGAAFAALIGADERRDGTVRIKDLKNGDQRDVAAAQATDWLTERLATQ